MFWIDEISTPMIRGFIKIYLNPMLDGKGNTIITIDNDISNLTILENDKIQELMTNADNTEKHIFPTGLTSNKTPYRYNMELESFYEYRNRGYGENIELDSSGLIKRISLRTYRRNYNLFNKKIS